MEKYRELSNEEAVFNKRQRHSWALSSPALLWLLVFFLVPYLIIFIYSFFSTDHLGRYPTFSLEGYSQIFFPAAGENYLRSFFVSFRMGLFTTLICIMLGYPAAYFIARSKPRTKNILLIMVIIPFFTNFMIRILAWRIFLAPAGVLSTFLMDAGLMSEQLRILRTDWAVLLVMVYVYLPYMILPLYSVIEKVEFSLLDAAKDLGARPLKSFFKITLPLTNQGIFAGTLLVFIPAMGCYIIPHIVGGRTLYIGQIIVNYVTVMPRKLNVASALSLILLLITCALVFLYIYLNNRYKKRGYGLVTDES
jgi:ABC-type spermidine/putrescine transport system permease subunit I